VAVLHSHSGEIDICVTHLPSAHCLLPVISIVQVLLALLLVGIHIPFGMLLLRFIVLPAFLQIYQLFNNHMTLLPVF
jgi:hypothetical protein